VSYALYFAATIFVAVEGSRFFENLQANTKLKNVVDHLNNDMNTAKSLFILNCVILFFDTVFCFILYIKMKQ
jgi:hypothetical protein